MIKNRIRNRLRREEGWLVVTAIAVTTMMVGVGLAIFSTVGTQQSMSRQERNRDSAFNLAESALYAQAFILSRNWPQSTNTGWTCTQAVTTNGVCPSFASIQNALDGTNIADFKTQLKRHFGVEADDAGAVATIHDRFQLIQSQMEGSNPIRPIGSRRFTGKLRA